MKRIFLFFNAFLLCATSSIHAETLFGNGTVTIATNETIIINYIGGSGQLYCDGQTIAFGSLSSIYAISGSHTIGVTNNLFYGGNSCITFQRLTNSAIQTIVLADDTTNISVPAGKTIQLFHYIKFPSGGFDTLVMPSGSTNTYVLNFYEDDNCPSITGPATITLSSSAGGGGFIFSYYFTDQIVQVPQLGILNIPSPLLEVDVQKSYDLKNWTTTAAFHTDAEAGAFYRLNLLK